MVRAKNILCIVIISILTLFQISCNEDTIQPEKVGNISGTVLDADDNTPISDASVTTSPPTNSLVTDNSGKFEYKDITAGEYTIVISKNNYLKNSVSVQVKDAETTTPIILLNKSTTNNTPPNEPSNPFPEENAANQSVSLNLAWSASDPDANDTLWFDVYLYKSNNPVKTQIASDITDTTISLENLQYNTTYFWQVVAKDGEASTNSNTWSFTTKALPDNPYLFASNRDGNYEIYTSGNTDSTTIQLTSNSNKDWWPRFSPNKLKIAFVSDEQVDPQIYTMSTDGSNVSKVTTLPLVGYHNNGIGFSWSPDGGHLIYANYNKLYMVDQFGANLTQLATAPADRHFRETDWSPASNKIVVLTIGENPYDSEIYLMDADGSNMTLLVDNLPGLTESPSFSTDGNKIVFTRDVSGYEVPSGRQLDSHIFIMNVDGSDTTDISVNKPGGTNDLHPRYSPDGVKIIFENVPNDGSGSNDIWIMDMDGNSRQKIISNGEMPDWK